MEGEENKGNGGKDDRACHQDSNINDRAAGRYLRRWNETEDSRDGATDYANAADNPHAVIAAGYFERP